MAVKAWLSIVGIGEDGMAGLSLAARKALEHAEIIIGGDRHHALSSEIKAERVAWPHPFDALIDRLRSWRGRAVAVLATGDPLWYSVGARIGREIPVAEIVYYPQLSAFQYAAARMGWSLADVETLTAHGRPVEQIIPWFWPEARLLVLTSGSETPGALARLLTERGYGRSRMHVLAHLGGPDEARIDGRAAGWAAKDPEKDIPGFHTLAIVCLGEPKALLSRLPGLPDGAFQHDGMITKQSVRAVTLAHLMPARGGVLWDIGTGCGSVAIEWMRAAPDARAWGIDHNAARLSLARSNAQNLGTPKLELIEGHAPEALAGLPKPDAVFIGGGLSEKQVQAAHAALGPSGRLVANAVTLESEAILMDLHAAMGGRLERIQIQQVEPVGQLRGWRPMMPVTQWSLVV